MRAEPDLAPVEDRDALAHIALALEPVDAPPAGRYRQADALGDLGGGLARVALEFAKVFYLKWIRFVPPSPLTLKSRYKNPQNHITETKTKHFPPPPLPNVAPLLTRPPGRV